MSALEQQHGNDADAREWLTRTLRWEVDLRILRTRHESGIAHAGLHALDGSQVSSAVRHYEPRIDRVA